MCLSVFVYLHVHSKSHDYKVVCFCFSYSISSIIRQRFFSFQNKDGSRSLRLFRKGKTDIIAKFYRADLVIYSHPREGKTLSHSRINMVTVHIKEKLCQISNLE